MSVSYKKLWKLLIDKDMKKKDLCERAGISPASVTKMGRNGHVTTEILVKICAALDCSIEDIVEIEPHEKYSQNGETRSSLVQAVSNTGRSGVLVLKVDEDDVNTVLMNTDIENDGSLKYAYDNFADAFSENILEYAFAYADIPRNQITKKQREAAQSLLKLHEIEKLRYYLEHDVPEEDWEPAFLRWYEKKGVLGEIVLHMFLKEFKNTIPLISKMYFKDSFSQEAKGFDAVHVSQDSLTLWLGETKFYKAWKTKGVVKGGIDELVEDLKKHITKDYLSEQYVIIKRGLETQLEHPQREEWIEKLSRPILLKDVFQYIRIPLLCIYEDDIALDYLKAIDDAVKDAGIVSHTATLRDYYNSINTFPYREQVQTVLILMPIEAKKKLVKCMLEKIWHMQNI